MSKLSGPNPLIAFAVLRIVSAATGGSCDDCVDYLTRRRRVLMAAVNATARERQLKPAELLVAYVTGFHDLHQTEATA